MNDRISAAQYQSLTQKPRRKYGNVLTTYKGRVYHSKAEAGWAAKLDALKTHGLIRSWVPQAPRLPLTDEPKAPTYTPDFMILTPRGQVILADCKGFDTEASKLKRAIVKNRYGIHVLVAWGDVVKAIEEASHG